MIDAIGIAGSVGGAITIMLCLMLFVGIVLRRW
jgi:hypothetical protein